MQPHPVEQTIQERDIILGYLEIDADTTCPVRLSREGEIDDVDAHFIKQVGHAGEESWHIMEKEAERSHFSFSACLPIGRQETARIHAHQAPAMGGMDHAFPARAEHGDDIVRELRFAALGDLMRDLLLAADDDLYGIDPGSRLSFRCLGLMASAW